MKKYNYLNALGLVLGISAISVTPLSAGVTITEIMQSNFGGVLDYYNEYPDSWVEVHNSDDQSIDLKGYSISEKNNIEHAYTIPSSLAVDAGGYALIFCDDENFNEHTNFKLNSDKPGTLYLWDADGALVDSVAYPEMIAPEVSWGRLPDDAKTFSHFIAPTPAAANTSLPTERVMKKVDFSEPGGIKKEPFWLKLSLKGDYPDDAVIRYTTDGTEPTNRSPIYFDSILVDENIVVRAKPFSDSAISKISKTHTYFFDDVSDKMPIVNLVCDKKYLFDKKIGILVSGTYYLTHHDVPSPREWAGNENYYYNWRRPINLEFYTVDSSGAVFNQLGETRISGNVSRGDARIKSMVVFANKRFGDKHFKGVLWPNLRPNADKQKSMLIRNSSQDEKSYALRDMSSQTAIGLAAKYYDIDFEAQRNVQFFINGEFQSYMHLQERDAETNVWANYNKLEDIELLDNSYSMYYGQDDEDDFPNFVEFRKLYRSASSSYQDLADLMDVNEFMNYVSTQAYFANVDFPNNNTVAWFDRQGKKKWRWILKDMDATVYEHNTRYYNFLLRKKPFKEDFANTEEACEMFQKMFSLNRFSEQYIDRTAVLAGTVFSKPTFTHMIDSIVGEMTLVMMDNWNLNRYLDDTEYFYEWSGERNRFYYDDLSQFFSLGDTAKLTIRSMNKDSMIFFNSNPLYNGRFDGYFFEGRKMYLTHDKELDIYGLKNLENPNSIAYLDLPALALTNDSVSTAWTVSYLKGGLRVVEHYSNDNLLYQIPEGAEDVIILDGYMADGSLATVKPISVGSRNPSDFTYKVYTVSGVCVGSFNYEQFRNRQQLEPVNIVVVFDNQGKRLFSVKVLKDKE